MANVLISIEKGIEVAAADVLNFLTKSQTGVTKMGPGVVATLAVLLGATETALTTLAEATATPLNIALDVQTVTDLRAVWPDVLSFAKALGITL